MDKRAYKSVGYMGYSDVWVARLPVFVGVRRDGGCFLGESARLVRDAGRIPVIMDSREITDASKRSRRRTPTISTI
jgi:hypothetical protein